MYVIVNLTLASNNTPIKYVISNIITVLNHLSGQFQSEESSKKFLYLTIIYCMIYKHLSYHVVIKF